MDLHDSRSGFLVGMRELDLAVKTSGSEQRGVEDVDAIGGGNHFNLTARRESVQLVEKLQHSTLHLAVAGLFRVESGVGGERNKKELKLQKRIKTKNFYIAGTLQDQTMAGNPVVAAGIDLALLSACNHTITSYGTYSFWAGFLAGGGKGKRIIPPFFPKYRMGGQDSTQFNVHPLRSKLPRFSFGFKDYR